MLTLISAAGVIIAVIVFLNLLSAGKRKKEEQGSEEPPQINVRRHLAKRNDEPNPKPRLRICPLCGTVLNQNEYLLASFQESADSNGKRQAHIYGCRHCFTTGGVNLSPGEARQLTHVEP